MTGFMKTKFLFALLIIVLGITLCPAPPPVYPPGRGGGGGTGGVYSNDTRTAVIATFYTNNTPHYIDGIARLGYSGAGTLTVSVTNSDNTRFFPFVYDALSVGATSNSLPFKVPPGGWWKFSGTGSTATDGTQVLTYNATNGAVTYATAAGNAATVTDGATQSGLAAGSYAIKVSALTSGNLTNFGFSVTNTTRGDAYRSFGLDTNGYFVSGYNNADRVGDEPGYNFFDVSGNTVGSIGVWMDHGGAPDTPEAIFAFDGNIAFLQARDGEQNKNIQLGRNSYSSGFINIGYGAANTSNGLSSITSGHSQRQVFPAIGPASNYAYPGFIGYWRTASGGMGGYGLGGIKIFDLVPLWTPGGNFSALQGVETLDVSKAGIVAAPSVPFIGSGSGITNQNYAVFQQNYNSGTALPTFPSGAWTNVLWTTNFGTYSYDSASAFTLSNSFIIVNASGAGLWRVRSSVPFYNNNSGSTGSCQTRFYRWSPSPSMILPGQGVYQYNYSNPNSHIGGVITLAAGDVIAVQAFAASTADTQLGRNTSSGEINSQAILELERQ